MEIRLKSEKKCQHERKVLQLPAQYLASGLELAFGSCQRSFEPFRIFGYTLNC